MKTNYEKLISQSSFVLIEQQMRTLDFHFSILIMLLRLGGSRLSHQTDATTTTLSKTHTHTHVRARCSF